MGKMLDRITQKEAIALINKQLAYNNECLIKDKQVTEKLDLGEIESERVEYIDFSNVTFDKGISLSPKHRMNRVAFTNKCKIEETLSIKGCNVGTLIFGNGSFSKVFVSQSHISHLDILDARFGDFYLDQLKEKVNVVTISKSRFYRLWIKGIEAVEGVWIRESLIEGDFEVYDVSLPELEVYSTIKGEITFKDATCDKIDLNINENELHKITAHFYNINCKEFSIYHLRAESISFYKDSLYGQLYLYYIDVESLMISKNVKIEEQLLISNKEKHKSDYIIGFFNLEVHNINRLSVHKLKVKNLLLSGIPERTLANFFDINIEEKLELRDFKNNYGGAITFNNIHSSKRGQIDIVNSDLTGVTFINIDFSKWESINFLDSKLVDTAFISTSWGDLSNIKSDDESKKIFNNSKKLRETFRQLKVAMSRQGNKIQELEFYAIEMDNYRKSLTDEDKFDKRFIFDLSHWTNRNGLEWVRPMIIAMISGAVIYLLLVLSTLFCSGNLFSSTCNFSLHDFFMVFNPTHNVDDYFIDCKWGAFYFFDFTGRIWMSIMIVQTVTGFRRYFRK